MVGGHCKSEKAHVEPEKAISVDLGSIFTSHGYMTRSLHGNRIIQFLVGK